MHERPEPCRVVMQFGLGRVQNLERLLFVRFGVRLHFGRGQGRPRRVPARRIADHRREIADDEHGGVSQILELAELCQDDGMTEVQIRGGRVHSQLDAQDATGVELLRQLLIADQREGAPFKPGKRILLHVIRNITTLARPRPPRNGHRK